MSDAKDRDRPRNWDKELADIDKLIAASGGDAPPTAPAPAVPPRTQPAGTPQVARVPGGRAGLFTWLRLLLGLALGAGMTQWPYTHGCGLQLYAYLGGVVGVIVAAWWSTISSWRTRSALAHFFSIGLLLWGLTLAAREVLPRVGYARASASWTCSRTPR